MRKPWTVCFAIACASQVTAQCRPVPPAPPIVTAPPPPRVPKVKPVYDGPADGRGVVAPTPTPAAPSAPVAAPAAPTPAAPPPAAPTRPRGYAVEADPTAWGLWWGFHRYDFLQVRPALHAVPVVSGSDDFYLGGGRRDGSGPRLDPTRAALERDVVPVLLAELGKATNPSVVFATMLALAKMDIADEDRRLLPLLTERLAAANQQIRESAALALGLTRSPRAQQPLIDLLLDTAAGRELVRASRVDVRTRAFAGHGLGLVGARADSSRARLAAMAFEQVLANPEAEPRDVLVAAIDGLGSLPAADIAPHLVRPLRQIYARGGARTDAVYQAHVPPALAAILGRGGDAGGEVVGRLVRDLEGGDTANVLRQSAAMALGELCDASTRHADANAALWRCVRQDKDQQARYFALVALGQIGGDANRTALLERLGAANTVERPWVALALGLLARAERPAGIDATIGRELRAAMLASKNEDVVAAAAIGLGLCGDATAAGDVRALLARNRHRDELAAHLCSALALLDDQAAVPLLREVVDASRRRPTVLTDAAIALVRLGDPNAGRDLARLLTGSDQELPALAGIAFALATVGDARCIPPLLEVLARDQVQDLARAFAIYALGGIGDRDEVPAFNALARRLNYRAAVETLTDQATGLLDLL